MGAPIVAFLSLSHHCMPGRDGRVGGNWDRRQFTALSVQRNCNHICTRCRSWNTELWGWCFHGMKLWGLLGGGLFCFAWEKNRNNLWPEGRLWWIKYHHRFFATPQIKRWSLFPLPQGLWAGLETCLNKQNVMDRELCDFQEIVFWKFSSWKKELQALIYSI